MPNLSPDFVPAGSLCTHTHATNKPSNPWLYGSFLNPMQPADPESHSLFLCKKPNSYKEKSENEILMVLTVVTQRARWGSP